jgi:hypothetical protein
VDYKSITMWSGIVIPGQRGEKQYYAMEEKNVLKFIRTGVILDSITVGTNINLHKGIFDGVCKVDELTSYLVDAYAVSIYNDIVIGIELDLVERRQKYFLGGSAYVKRNSSFHHVVKALNVSSINWVFNQKLTFDDQVCVTTDSGVDFVFGKEKNNTILLAKAICIKLP